MVSASKPVPVQPSQRPDLIGRIAKDRLRILMIGATGYIGRAVIRRLLADGHHILGVVRKEADVGALEEAGVECLVAPGGFHEIKTIKTAAVRCDAVIDVAAHNFTENTASMLELRKSLSPGKVLISTSGAFFYGDCPDSKGKPVSEDRPFGFFPQIKDAWTTFEASVLNASEEGVLSALVRCGVVYGNGSGGHGGGVIGAMEHAVKAGFAHYIDDGRAGTFCNVHVDDLADLYALVLNSLISKALSSGSVVNASPGHLPHKEYAEAVAAACGGLPVQALTPESAKDYIEPFRIYTGTLTCILDNSTARSLGWNPWRPSLKWDLLEGSYKGLIASSRM